jgi:hypothetical protein
MSAQPDGVSFNMPPDDCVDSADAGTVSPDTLGLAMDASVLCWMLQYCMLNKS